jgi:penicillin-binding protein 1C
MSRLKFKALALGLGLGGAWLFLRFLPLPAQGMEALRNDWGYAALDSEGGLARLALSPLGRYRVRERLVDISPELRRGFVAYEDAWFYWHPGFNPLAFCRALAQNLSSGRVVSGASTITMQLARLMQPRSRSYAAKALETLRALQLEARFSKDELLELYLNSVPLGGNIQGVGAASLLYFGKPSSKLSLGEAALLISLPKNPSARRPDRSGSAPLKGRDAVLKKLVPALHLDPQAASEAYAASVPSLRLRNPDRMPHLTRRLDAQLRQQGFPRPLAIQPALQSLAEGALERASLRLRPYGIQGGAVIILQTSSRKVLAYVGSPDFSGKAFGQVNGADIPRSPGSALKPFLYGLALQGGLITPRSLILDIPREYGSYRPANFFNVYAGPVAAEEALARSLNTPAVWLEAQLRAEGKPYLEAWLKDNGLGRNPGQSQAGLSVALGAWPITLEDMAEAYSMLGDQGRLKALRFFDDDGAPEEGGRQALSPEAAWLVCEMISKVQRPDLPNSWEYTPSRAKVAFKTGTSFGLRDFWCLALTPDYTVGVWLGNPDARGAPALSAAGIAAPVAFEVLNSLVRSKDAWFPRPKGLVRRKVCALSGLPPGPDCHDLEEDDSIPGLSPVRTCPVHKRYWVRKKDGKRLAADCLGEDPKAVEQRVFEIWPPDVAHFMRLRGMLSHPLPPPASGCLALSNLVPPRILSPAPGTQFELRAALPLESQRVPLTAQSTLGGTLTWLIDGAMVAEGQPGQSLFWLPNPGRHTALVLDSEGGAQESKFSVLAEQAR